MYSCLGTIFTLHRYRVIVGGPSFIVANSFFLSFSVPVRRFGTFHRFDQKRIFSEVTVGCGLAAPLLTVLTVRELLGRLYRRSSYDGLGLYPRGLVEALWCTYDPTRGIVLWTGHVGAGGRL